uniref:NADH-ubiquinone oxidoreductase chain 2 n=1 Tax=Halocynthia roretzi TaxID=7729 RepID=Q9T9H2_HALRO|nr:NADH dehydrogenase subunit 2 [Halocynthia roretzi]BAA88258.1 NADH dehydrogenase subunit 2 [Halocynthia roretzi]
MGYLMPGSLVFVLNNGNSLVMWVVLEVFSLYVLFVVLRYNLRDINMIGVVYYFLVQGVGGVVLAFGVIYELSVFGNCYVFQCPVSYLGVGCIIVGLFLKLGVFPFYFWVVWAYKLLDGVQCYYLAVYPKIFPFLFLFSLFGQVGVSVFLFVGLASIFLSGVEGLFASDIREFMGFSSIGHGGWMLFCFYGGIILFVLYYVIYYVCNYVVFNMMYGRGFNIFFGFGRGRLVVGMGFILFIIILNLGGFRPSLGFGLKLMILSSVYLFWGVVGGLGLLFVTIAAICLYRLFSFYMMLMMNYCIGRSMVWKRWFYGYMQAGLILIFVVFYWGLFVV